MSSTGRREGADGERRPLGGAVLFGALVLLGLAVAGFASWAVLGLG